MRGSQDRPIDVLTSLLCPLQQRDVVMLADHIFNYVSHKVVQRTEALPGADTTQTPQMVLLGNDQEDLFFFTPAK